MNIFFMLRVSSVLFLGNFASCRRTGESKNSHSPRIQNEMNNQTSNEAEKPIASKTKTVMLKPCDRQKKRVASFIFPQNVRPFIPLCDSNGYYMPLQCHPSNGYCWCVDKNGNMKHGSRTKGVIDCGWKAIMKKPCERHRLRSLKHKSRSHPSIFVPRCGKDGYYSPMQCSAGNKFCWCVDKHGHKKRGTRTKGIIDCSKPKDQDQSSHTNADDVYSPRGGADGPCFRHKRRRNSLNSDVKRKYFDPNCDEDGFYATKQCHGGLCWCSHRNGNFIAGSKKKGDVDCESRSASGPTRPLISRCYTERLRGLKSSLTKMQFVPLCSLEGSYAPIQCDTQQGYCWCSDKWGNEIKNSRTKRTPKCLTNGHNKKPCYELKKFIKQLPTIGKIYIPVCKRSGYYKSLQCSRDKKYCWCVEQDGTELKGTVTFGKPECPERSINMSHVEVMKVKNGPCTRQKEQRKKLILVVRRNLFNPRCNEFGFYDIKQCHGKYCWCTDKNGKMIKGTKQIGNVDCAKFAGPHATPCLANRLKALRISVIKKPYVPQCESGGDYMPLQCNVHTGECWCVDKGGKQFPGSRTRRTPNCFAKAFNSVQDGPCHILKSYISKLPPNTMVNDPICEGSGFFQPSQCGRSNGFCWCVMPDGTEVQGSLTFGKPNCHEKRSPAVPRLRGPCDEHLAHVNNMVYGERKNVYTPVCDDEGYYASHQCNNDTTWCWCVNKYGSLIKGTRLQGKLLNCDEKMLKPCDEFNKKKEDVNQGVDNNYDAMCTEKGYFAPLQCNVNSGKCWCVDNMGSVLPGTTIYQRPYCGKEQRKCEIERRNSLSKANPTMVPLSCDVHGYYSRLQCHHLTNECWCSDIYGKETAGTRVNGIAICGQLPRPCDEHASTASNYDNLFGVFIPQCDSQGYYAKIQCHEKTNICWCSNKVGVEIPGTKTNGQPNCFF